MATRSVTVPTRAQTTQPCPCGCAPCTEHCCRLDCLVQPRFFCGQLLTDQDLTALIGWTQNKLRLTRYRQGWGVVCGLEVRCDPQQVGQVIVSPGYAVSCCGDDIIVCEDASVDLRQACRVAKDPCAELQRPEGGGTEPEIVRLAGRDLPANEVHLIDLYLSYREEPSEPQTALGRQACKAVSECEYSRTREVFTLTPRPAVLGSDPIQAAAVRWRETYTKCMEVVSRFRNAFPVLTDFGTQIRQWLVNWIANHPLHQFCFVHDWVCTMSPEQLTTEPQLVEILFWLVQDCRNAFLSCDCFSCQESPGVPLARVWLRAMTDSQGQQRCHVLEIDAYAPYRRPMSPECWPAPLGAVNVGRTIWHRWEEACTMLDELGVQIDGQEPFVLPSTLADLETALPREVFVPCGEARIAQLLTVEGLGERVVGFRGQTTTDRVVRPIARRRQRPV